MPSRFLLTNAGLVLPDRLLDGGTLVVEEGAIAEIVGHAYPPAPGVLDLGGRLLLPGLVDLHNDALEREINPRPGAGFDPTFALLHLDRKLAAAGVTTQFHAVSFAERSDKQRTVDRASQLCHAVNALRAAPHAAVDNAVLHRLDLRTPDALDRLLTAMTGSAIPLVSLNDHVPGQGQYRDLATYRQQIRPFLDREADEAELDAVIADRLQRAAETEHIVGEVLARLALEAPRRGMILVSHDDDSADRVDLMHELGCRVAEFPLTLAAAERAAGHGMHIAMGAPNALRGGSLSGNISALELLGRGLVDILVADYHAPALLGTLFRVIELGMADLPTAARLLTLNPAAAAGLSDRGALEPGRRADLIVLERYGGIPIVDATFVAGALRYAGGPFAPALAALGLPAPAIAD